MSAARDQHGLSFYRDTTIAGRLRIREQAVVEAREELVTYDLVAYQPPLTQVLSLPPARLERKDYPALRALFQTSHDPGGSP